MGTGSFFFLTDRGVRGMVESNAEICEGYASECDLSYDNICSVPRFKKDNHQRKRKTKERINNEPVPIFNVFSVPNIAT